MRDPESPIPISSLCSLTANARSGISDSDIELMQLDCSGAATRKTRRKLNNHLQTSTLGGLTEWLRSSPGKRVRCNSPAGSSPVPSAIKPLEFQRFLF